MSCVVAVVWAFDVERWFVYSACGEVRVGLLGGSLSLCGAWLDLDDEVLELDKEGLIWKTVFVFGFLRCLNLGFCLLELA